MITGRRDYRAEAKSSLTDPMAVCDALGLLGRHQRQTRGVTILCPFHGEHSPSCSVTRGPDGTIRVKCFGCGATGDVFTLIGVVHGLEVGRAEDFKRALAIALELATMEPMTQREPPPPEPPALDVETFDVIARTLALFCPLHGDVADYLDARGLLDAARDAGFCALPSGPALRWVRDAIVDVVGANAWRLSGLTWGDDWAYPANRLVIPWRQRDGRVFTMQRRRLDDAKEHKYVFPLKRSPRSPFGVERLDASSPVAFCEGALDVLSLRIACAKFGANVIPLGVPGVDGLAPDWARLANGREAIIATDADDAGERAVEQWADMFYANGATEVTRWTPLRGKDWTEAG